MRAALAAAFLALGCVLSPSLVGGQGWPGQPSYPLSGPSPVPVLPSYDDTFTPPTSTAAPVSGSPIFGAWNHQAQPGETLLFTGSQLGGFSLYGQTSASNGTLMAVGLLLQNTLESQITLPSCLPANSTYLVWSTNASGASAPACLNCTELWWGRDTLPVGDTGSVYGRNFYYGGITPTVYVQVPGASGMTASLVDYNNYRIDYTMPNLGVTSGTTVDVWVHNGHGGAYGWSGPVTVTVQTTVNDESYWTGSTFNVKNFGALGNGVTDDGPAITMALTTAAQSYAGTGLPATVYLPGSASGTTYLTNMGFNNLAHVRWMGDGPTETTLSLGPLYSASAGPYGLFYEASGLAGHGNNVEIEGMTLNMNGNLQSTEAASIGYSLFYETGVNNLKLYNLTIYSGETLPSAEAAVYSNSTTLIFEGEASHAWIQNCTVYGGGFVFGAQNQVFVDQCNFYGQYDAGFFTGAGGSNGFSMTGCTAQDYANTLTFTPNVNLDPNPYYFEGRLFDGGGNGNHGVYIAGNTTIDCAPRVGLGNDLNGGEQILWEGGLTSYNGALSSAGTNTVQIPASGTAYGPDSQGRSYYYVVVVAGDGLGQYRAVTADNGHGLLSVSPAWNVIPDSTSTLQVQGINDDTVVYGNQLQGKPGYLTSGTSSAGVEPYANCFDFSVDSNQISQMVTGLFMWSIIDSNGLHPGYFDLFINNTVSNSISGATTNFDNFTAKAENGIGLLGVDMRRNNLNNTASGAMLNGFRESASDSTGYSPRIVSTLIDQNNASYLSSAAVAPVPAPAQITATAFTANNFCTGAEPCGTAIVPPCIVPTSTPTYTPLPPALDPAPSTGTSYLFPSPARGATAQVAYEIPGGGQVEIFVYNESGSLVDTVEDDKPAGSQTSVLSTGKFAPGVYFYVCILRPFSGPVRTLPMVRFAVIH